MKTMIVVAGMLMMPGAMFAQEEKVLSAQEMLEATLKDLHGLQQPLHPSIPGMRPAQPSSPNAFWTTAPLPPPPRPVAEAVSVASLRHHVPKAAKKAFDRAANLVSKGDTLSAQRELGKAVALDPDYAAAHSDLGVLHIQWGRLQEGEAEIRRALELDPFISQAHSNLGWILFSHRKFEEAERSARRALSLSPNNDNAHLLLGLLLGAWPATRAEGLRHIEQATTAFPEVERLAAELRAH